jgi:PAS domain S-box-containing protein
VTPQRLLFTLLAVMLCGLVTPVRALDPARGASQYRFEEWLPSEGVLYPSIRALTQDSDGYIWMATRAGVGRFDGVKFTAVPLVVDGAEHAVRAQCMVLTAKGQLLVGTDTGILRYESGEWVRPAEFQFVSKQSVRTLLQLPGGELFIGCRTQLYLYREGVGESNALPPGMQITSVNRAVVLRDGGVAVAARPFVVLKNGHVSVISGSDGLSDLEAICAAEDREGGLWIGSARGLQRWKNGTFTNYSVRDGLPVSMVRSLLVDRDDNVWVGTPNGLSRYRNGQFENVLVHGVEKLSHVLCLFEDREGNIWGGTDNGAFRLSDAPFANIGQRDGLQASSVFTVMPASDGSLWVGTWGGGLARLKDGQMRTYRMQDGLVEDAALCITEDRAGRIWFGYYTRGVGCYDGVKFVSYGAAEGAGERVVRMAVTPDETVWAMDELNGLKRFHQGRFELVHDVPMSGMRAMFVASDGALWVGGAEGAARYQNGEWRAFRLEKSRADLAQAFFETADGAVWLLRDGRHLERYSESGVKTAQLPAAFGPLAYGGAVLHNELWASFRFGVIRAKLDELNALVEGRKSTLDYTLYDESAGMRSRAPNSAGSPAVSVVRGDSVWFATSKGISMISPSRIRRNLTPPRVLIEGVEVDKSALKLQSEYRLPVGRGEMEIKYTAISHTNPTHVLFRYRLLGFEHEWSSPSRERSAHYGGLPAGTYTFEVVACNSDNVWSPDAARVRFVLLPPLYHTWWFRLTILLAVLVIGLGIYRWRVAIVDRRADELLQQNLLLEQRIAARTAELEKSNQALKASEYFYHSLIESLPQIILRKDCDGRIQYVNSSFCELMRRPLHEVIGKIDYDLCSPEIAAKLRADDQRVLATGEVMEHEHFVDREGEPRRYLHCKRVPLYDNNRTPIGIQVIFWDMTRFRETEEKLKEAQRELAETSRLAGIAEMATGVLHNIGNALNSVNTSSSMVADVIRSMKLQSLARASELLKTNQDRLGDFLTTDPKGKQLPQYLGALAEHLESERGRALVEIAQMEQSVAHIREIVVAQQSHAKVSGYLESVSAAELLEFSLRITETALRREGVVVSREFMPTPPVKVPKQKVLQILVNLVRNATDSLKEAGRPDKRLVLGVRLSESGKVQIRITDNGVGISEENLTRIFAFGFTTKKSGHGFGLHSSALAAREMNGALTVTSPGVGKGASFILELPADEELVARDEQRAPVPAVAATRSATESTPNPAPSAAS